MFISQIKLRNFKSFKTANILLDSKFVAFAGPNGSGKSNICDSILFNVGEMGTKILRIKSTKDLIHKGESWTESTVIFQDQKEKHTIIRKIRKDGKIEYKLNGKKVSRTSVREFLRRRGIDDSGRNIIAQGRIKKIIEMSGRDRRGIIDSVAGISDFEVKKNEALGELNSANDRIKEANIILGEKLSFLRELGIEKVRAEKYIKARDDYKKAKKTILKLDKENYELELGKHQKGLAELNDRLSTHNAEKSNLDLEIHGIESKRDLLSAKIQASTAHNPLMNELEENKTKIEVNKTKIENLEKELVEVNARSVTISMDVDREQLELNAIKREFKSVEARLGSLKKELPDRIRDENREKEIGKLKDKISQLYLAIGERKEEITKLKTQIEEKESRVMDLKESAKNTLDSRTRMAEIKKIIKELNQNVREMFNKSREVSQNKEQLDSDVLKLKEKLSLLKLKAKPSRANPAVEYINNMVKSGNEMNGIHGFVSNIISFDPRYTEAIDAAGGARLRYVVVDNIDTAVKTIKNMKSRVKGRLSFIPIKNIRERPPNSNPNVGVSLLNLIEYNNQFEKAIAFAFGNTVLVSDVATAKKAIRTGYRAVTITGELFETSGVVSGGKRESTLFINSQIKALESEISEISEERRSSLMELTDIRNRESEIRSKKSKLEVELRGFEIELGHNAKVDMSITSLQNIVSELILKLGEKTSDLKNMEDSLQKNKLLLSGKKSELDELMKKENENFIEISNEISSLESKKEGLTRELNIKENHLEDIRHQLGELNSKKMKNSKKMEELTQEIHKLRDSVSKSEEHLAKVNKEMENAFSELKKYDESFRKIGEKLARVKSKIDRVTKDMNDIKIKQVSVETHLQDIIVEFESLQDIESLKIPRENAMQVINESEQIMNNITDVNLSSIKMYEEKKDEINKIREKIDHISNERKAILNMIKEIEERKKETFFKTFENVKSKFKQMFQYLKGWDGELYLDKPDDVFNSELNINVSLNDKTYLINALSGGESSLVSLMFIFALQFVKPSPFYILDEVDADLDKANSQMLANLIRQLSSNSNGNSQFIIVSHNEHVIAMANTIIGVSKINGVSSIVGVNIKKMKENEENTKTITKAKTETSMMANKK